MILTQPPRIGAPFPRMPRHRARRGSTLIELVITIALITVVTAVVTLGVRRIARPEAGDVRAMLADSLTVAISERRDVLLDTTIGGRRVMAVARRDGSVTADSLLGFDLLSGRVARGTRAR